MHRELGRAALQGWRAKVADAVAPGVASRTPLDEELVRAAVGLVFLGLAARYVMTTFRQALAD